MESKGILEVFNVDVENINLEEDTKKESVYYKPRQDGKDPYTALIRFLPIPIKTDDKIAGFEQKPYYMQKRYWLKDDQGNGNYYASAATIGERCPIQTTFFRFYNSDDIKEKKMAKDFNLSTHFWSLIHIIDDKQNPDLVGKVLIWRYTNDIKKLIEKELNPVVSEYQKKAKDKIAVWDLLKGKNLALVVGQDKVKLDNKERVFPNYDASEFLDSSPIVIDGVVVENSKKSMESVTKLFEASAINEIAQYKYEPWDEEAKENVNRILARYNGTTVDTAKPIKENDLTDDENDNVDDADAILEKLKL